MKRFISQKAQLVQSYYSGIGKLGVIYPAASLVSIGIGFVQLGIIFYAKDVLGLPATMVGVLAATWSVPYALSCIFLRPLFDRVYPRYLMMGATFLMACFIYLITLVDRVGLVFLFYACFGAVMALFWSPTMGWLSTESEGRDLNRLLARFNMSWGIGTIIAPYIAGWLYERAPILPIRFGSILFLVVSAFIAGAAMALPRIRTDVTSGASSGTEGGEDRSTPFRFPAWVGVWACFFGVGVISAVFPLSARSELGMTESGVGRTLLFFSLFSFLGHFILGRTSFWHFRLSSMLGAMLLRVIAFGLFIWASTAIPLAMLMAAFGITAAVCYASSGFHGSSGSVNRAKRMAIHEALLASGIVIGSVMGGVLYDKLSAAVAYAAAAVVSMAAIILQVSLSRRLKAARTKPETGSGSLLPPLQSDE